jgi:hypothetical protein
LALILRAEMTDHWLHGFNYNVEAWGCGLQAADPGCGRPLALLLWRGYQHRGRKPTHL